MKITDSKYKSVLSYAKKMHNGQFRMNGKPFIIHPFMVSRILIEKGFDDVCVLAGLIHDVREDCKVPFKEILEFLMTVLPKKDAMLILNIVWFLTKVKGSTPEQTIKRILACKNPEIRNRVIAVKFADILANTRQTITLENISENVKFKSKWIEKANRYLSALDSVWEIKLLGDIKGSVFKRDISDALDRLEMSTPRKELHRVTDGVVNRYTKDVAKGIA